MGGVGGRFEPLDHCWLSIPSVLVETWLCSMAEIADGSASTATSCEVDGPTGTSELAVFMTLAAGSMTRLETGVAFLLLEIELVRGDVAVGWYRMRREAETARVAALGFSVGGVGMKRPRVADGSLSAEGAIIEG